MPRAKKPRDSAGSPAIPAADPSSSMENRLQEFAQSTLAHLDAQQAVLDRRLAALRGHGIDKDLAMAGAALARARSTALGELRKLEKHDRTIAKSPAQRFALVKEFLRVEALPAQRAEVMAMLAELVEQRSVLS